MTHQEKEFRDGNILSLLIRFSIPATFAILIGIIYNVTDRYYIGQAVGRKWNFCSCCYFSYITRPECHRSSL